MQTDELLKTTLTEVLSLCLDRGMKMPLLACMMSRNGSVIVVRCVPDREEPIVLAERNQEDNFVSPIGVLVLDQNGQAEKFVVDRSQVMPDPSN